MIANLFDLPLDRLGPDPADFAHASTIHGPSHVCRVQAYTILLALKTGYAPELRPAFCAAYLHDLSRRDDGVDTEHGRLAVEEKLGSLLPFFARLGLTPEWIDHVRTAVTNHCVLPDPPRDHPHYRVTALLKDADALDRWRIHEAPAAKYLRLPVTAAWVPLAETIYEQTRRMTAFDEIWPVAWRLLGKEI